MERERVKTRERGRQLLPLPPQAWLEAQRCAQLTLALVEVTVMVNLFESPPPLTQQNLNGAFRGMEGRAARVRRKACLGAPLHYGLIFMTRLTRYMSGGNQPITHRRSTPCCKVKLLVRHLAATYTRPMMWRCMHR